MADMMPDSDALPDGHRATVAATWSLSAGQANHLEAAGLAKPLLKVASLIDANGIPTDVLTSAAVVRWLSGITGRDVTAEDARDALGCLRRLSSITFAPLTPHQAVRVHALVQLATRDNTSRDRVQTIARIVAEALLETWPAIERDSSFSQVLRANAEALDAVAGEHLWADGAHRVLSRVGQGLGNRGLVVQARDWYTRLRDAATEQFGLDHRATLNARHNCALWRREAGDPGRAVTELEEVLRDKVRVLGTEHRQPSTIGVITTSGAFSTDTPFPAFAHSRGSHVARRWSVERSLDRTSGASRGGCWCGGRPPPHQPGNQQNQPFCTQPRALTSP